MRKLFAWCLLFPMAGFSQQKLHVTLFGGFSNYQGDLQGKSVTFNQANLGLGVGVKYDFTPKIAVRLGFNYGKLEASDKLNDEPLLKARNLSFQSRILEGNLLAEYTFFDLWEKKLSPYVFAGIALFHFDPYAYDTSGNKVHLQPLSTEGQGLAAHPEKKPYKLTQFAIPFGAGIKFRVSDNAVLGYEIGLRKLFTDYLDDVSGRYPDQFALASERGMKAVEMSYRGGELKDGDPNFPAAGVKRGGKAKDWYYFTGLTLTIAINSGQGGFLGGGNGKQRLGCPPPKY